MSALPLDPNILVVSLGLFLAVILYLREYNLRKKVENENGKFLEKIKEKGWNTLNESIKKSQNILAEAELEGIGLVAGSKLETAKMEKSFQDVLTEELDTSKQTIIAAQGQLIQFMQDLQKRSAEFEEAGKKAGEERINQLFERVENRLSDFLVQTAQKSSRSIELELKSARELIETYKNEQLKVIDENIVAMMEQALSTVIGKKLSLKDEMDLIYEALEKAKAEKFIV